MKLTDWIPALSIEINGANSTPNWDMIFHMQAQRIARSLGIKWAMEMPEDDVNRLRQAIREKFGK